MYSGNTLCSIILRTYLSNFFFNVIFERQRERERQNPKQVSTYLTFKNFFLFIFETETEHEWGRGRERGRNKI